MEKYCEIKTEEGVLRGMLHCPSTTTYPLVIMCHGFTSSRQGPRFAFVRLARQLEKLGIGTMRFDFLGSGESDLDFSTMTYLKECKQVMCILEEAKKLKQVTDIYLLGHSMGGAIAGNIASLYPDLIKRCVLWAPAFCMPDLINAMSASVSLLPTGYYDCKGLNLSQDFVQEMLNLNLYEKLNHYKNPLMIIHGTHDQTVPFESSKAYLQAFNRNDIEFYQLEKGSHNFEVCHEIEYVLSHTIHFLIKSE